MIYRTRLLALGADLKAGTWAPPPALEVSSRPPEALVHDISQIEYDNIAPNVTVTRLHHAYASGLAAVAKAHGPWPILLPQDSTVATTPPAQLFARQGITDADTLGTSDTWFEELFLPAKSVDHVKAREEIEFDDDLPYSQYNWEAFFHAPMLVAQRLSSSGRYEEAQRWLHAIFDPVRRAEDASSPEEPHFSWRFRPFVDASFRTSEGLPIDLERWRDAPFDPHLLARLRPASYEIAVVIQYVDNLVNWGDSLFRIDTREAIREATQIYNFALEVLGPRPPEVRFRSTQTALSFRQLAGSASTGALDPDHWTDLAADYDVFSFGRSRGRSTESADLDGTVFEAFCVPPNPRLGSLWTTIEDRLHKIRNGLDLLGRSRSLALFAPPIDPWSLLRGQQLSLQVSDLAMSSGPAATTRFRPTLALAEKVAREVGSLGASLLSALERKDGETITKLRNEHQSAMLAAVSDVRRRQVSEAILQLEAAKRAQEMATAREAHYANLLGAGLLPSEHANLRHTVTAGVLRTTAGGLRTSVAILRVAGVLHLTASPGSELGPAYVAGAIEAAAQGLEAISSQHGTQAQLASAHSTHARREQEWSFQHAQATREISNAALQVRAAHLRLEIAQKELENHGLQERQEQEVRDFLESKQTHEMLYSWMVTELQAGLSASLGLAIDLARAAERAYRQELGVSDTSFVGLQYADTEHHNLLAGNRLVRDLQTMEASYQTENTRNLGLTKDLSLTDWYPEAVLQLRDTGSCSVDLDEVIFDLDGPGHYDRRIVDVALTLACVRGGSTTVPCKLTLVSSSVRGAPVAPSNGDWRDHAEGLNLRSGSPRTIVTSRGVRDRGVLDGQGDGRLLPFEGEGVISSWRLELPNAYRSFDYATITDVVLHLTFQARDGGSHFRSQVEQSIEERLDTLGHHDLDIHGEVRSVSLRRSHPDRFSIFRAALAAAAGPVGVTLPLATEDLPAAWRISGGWVKNVLVLLQVETPMPELAGNAVEISSPSAQTATTTTVAALAGHPNVLAVEFSLPSKQAATVDWTLTFDDDADGAPPNWANVVLEDVMVFWSSGSVGA